MTPAATPAPPRNARVVLLDSLNRHMLGAWGSGEFDTPNLDRFARQHATSFTNHITGSLPCMPARHDLLCGSLDFLWKPWGSIELWEAPITRVLSHAGVTTALVTDHPHLFETGGENYHTDFDGWDYLRGHEGDLWRTHADPTWAGAPALAARAAGWWANRVYDMHEFERGYDRSRTFFRTEADWPGPRTMTAAARFLTEATPHHDRWFLFVDEFDPHEPFDTPEPWASRYHDGDTPDEWLIWPPYVSGGVSKGSISAAEAQQIRANYGSKLAMIDHWFGRILDAFDEQNLWADTALILCTDHGHYLGEEREGHDIWGKPAVAGFEPLVHTPLMIHWPGVDGGDTCDALTTNVDLFATVADIFDADVPQQTHGYSLMPLLDGTETSVRDWAMGGYWGRWVQITDGTMRYTRGAVDSNYPLSMWSNRWSTMPLHLPGFDGLPVPDSRAVLDTMPGSDIPVIRQPFAPGDKLPFWAAPNACVDNHHLYNLDVDPGEAENRCDESAANAMVDLLHSALTEVEAPNDQFDRLGLS